VHATRFMMILLKSRGLAPLLSQHGSFIRQFSSFRHFGSLPEILKQVQEGKLTPDDAHTLITIQRLTTKSPEQLLESFANLDHYRSKRTGFPEAVFAEGKTPQQVAAILDNMALSVNNLDKSERDNVSTTILATR